MTCGDFCYHSYGLISSTALKMKTSSNQCSNMKKEKTETCALKRESKQNSNIFAFCWRNSLFSSGWGWQEILYAAGT